MLRKVIWVLHIDSMHVVSGVKCQNFWNIVHGHLINTALHQAKQVMIKLWHTYCLVKDQEVCLAISGVVKGKRATDSLVGLHSHGWVIPQYLDRPIIILKN